MPRGDAWLSGPKRSSNQCVSDTLNIIDAGGILIYGQCIYDVKNNIKNIYAVQIDSIQTQQSHMTWFSD